MKYLIIPGLPLLTVALSLRDASSPPAVITCLVAIFFLIFGAAFVLLYAAHRALSKYL